jgi:hypothetical protein
VQPDKQFIQAAAPRSVSRAPYFYQRSFGRRIGSGFGKLLRDLVNLAWRQPAVAFPLAAEGPENCKEQNSRDQQFASAAQAGFDFVRNICGLTAALHRKITQLFWPAPLAGPALF